MTIKEVIPLFERTLDALKAMPEDIEIISIVHTFLDSDTSANVHVSGADGIKRLAMQYGSSLQREAEGPNKHGTIWNWLRFSALDNFLCFVQCERETAPSDVTTGSGEVQSTTKDTPIINGGKEEVNGN